MAKLAKPVISNRGVAIRYRRAIDKEVQAMLDSFEYWLQAAYRKAPPLMAMAQDASPVLVIKKIFAKLSKYWLTRFNKRANEIASYHVGRMFLTSDKALQKVLKDAGWAVDFKMTKEMQDALNANIAANVGLIKSIPAQLLPQIEGVVMRSYSAGRDLKTMVQDIRALHPVTQKRAALIARDQSNKANAVVNRTRCLQLGITEAKWMHSSAGKKPRKSHVEANGKIYDIEKGCKIDGDYIQPGELINCLPYDSPLEFFPNSRKFYRRHFTGKLTKIVTGMGATIEATENHPVLTQRGWIAIKDINLTDYVIKVKDQQINLSKSDDQQSIPSIGKVFDALSVIFGIEVIAPTSIAQFHGDATNNEVDIINMECFLIDEVNIIELQQFFKFFFASANHLLVNETKLDIFSTFDFFVSRSCFAPDSLISSLTAFLFLRKRHLSHTNDISSGTIAQLNALLFEAVCNNMSSNLVFFGKGQHANSADIFSSDDFIRKFYSYFLFAFNRDSKTSIFNISADDITVKTNDSSGIFESISVSEYELDRVINIGSSDFSGHVYNLENKLNWYTTEKIITHNCRCTYRAVLPI
jgi:hypothetical protein